MNEYYRMILQWFLPLAFVLAGYLVGRIVDKMVFVRLEAFAKATEWRFDDIIIGALHKMATVWCMIAGIYVALLYISIPTGYFDAIHKTLVVLAILSVTVVLARIAVDLVNRYSVGVLPSSSIFANLTKLIVYVIGILVILQTLNISIAPIITALGVGGLAVALALQDTLSNLFSGLHIIISRQVSTGDYVKLDSGEEGYVTDITWRNTTIRALPNNLIVIPNAKLASAIITNFNQPDKEMAVLVQVGISYESDLEKAERDTIEVAREVMREISGGVPEFEPFIHYHTFGDSSINFTVIMRCKEFVDQYLIKHEFVKRLHQRYQQEGIEIPFPIRTVHMKSD